MAIMSLHTLICEHVFVVSRLLHYFTADSFRKLGKEASLTPPNGNPIKIISKHT